MQLWLCKQTDVDLVSQLMLRKFVSEVCLSTNTILHGKLVQTARVMRRCDQCVNVTKHSGQYSPMNDTYDRIVLAVLMLEHRQKALSDDIESPVVPYALTHSSINQTFTDSTEARCDVVLHTVLVEHHSDVTDILNDLQTFSSLCLMLVLVFQFFAAM
jgi:hypothetical protein